MHIVVETPIANSPRVQQVRGIFDLAAEKTSRLSWDVHLPLDQAPWSIGLIVGPSGCGKTTLARRLFDRATYHEPQSGELDECLAHGSVVDAFPEALAIQDIAA